MDSENMFTDEEAATASEESARHLISKLMKLTETGELHDCTIRASSPTSSAFKDFQCHKLILSLSSVMFKTMFSSSSKEAQMRPDEPIVLQNVEPEVFACVMRYMYGCEKNIKDISFGAEVYKLAHRLQMESLIQELDIFKESKNASEVFAIFDLHLGLGGNQMMLTNCKLLLQRETAAALASEQWLNVSMEAVQEFLKIDLPNVEEIDLAKALLRWGKHQVQKDGDDPTDGKKLRVKIFPALKFIRFAVLTQCEFANLCLEELGAVLNLEERNAVFLALATKNLSLMPRELSTPETAMPRKKTYAVCQLAFIVHSNRNFTHGPLSARIGFVLSKNSNLVAFKVNSKSNPVYEDFRFELLNANKTVIGLGSSKDKITTEGEEFVEVNPSCSITAGTKYTLDLSFPCSNLTGYLFQTFYSLLPNQSAATSNGLTLSITTACLNVYLEKMMFALT